MECNESEPHQKMASTEVHCRLWVWVTPGRVNTLHRICRKTFGNPKKNIWNKNLTLAPKEKRPALINGWVKPGSSQYLRNDYRSDHVIRCTFPMLQAQWRTATLAIWQSILEDKMLKICAHFAAAHDKCTAKTSAASIGMSTETVHPSCPESMSWIEPIVWKMDLKHFFKFEETISNETILVYICDWMECHRRKN